MSRKLQFFGNMGKAVSGSSVQLLITLIATPIMTRLFVPEAYATFGIINTTATVMTSIGLLTLPAAYTAERDSAMRDTMLHAMVWLVLITSGLAALLGVGVAVVDHLQHSINVPLIALVFLPILVLSYGTRQIVINMGIQRGMFGRLSMAQIADPLVARGGSIALGATLGGNPLFILVSVMVGQIVSVSLVLRRLPREAYSHWRGFWRMRGELRASLARVGDFVIYGTGAQQMQHLILLGMQVGIAGFFSAHLAGQYILAVSILTMPISIVALATAPVIYHHFIGTERDSPKLLMRDFLAASMLYASAGAVILMPLYFFGEPLFRFVFGENWGHAGIIAGILSIAYIGTFVLTGVQSIFMVTRRLKLQFFTELLSALLFFAGAVYCFKTMDFDRALLCVSGLWLLRAGVLFGACLVAVTKHNRASP